MKILLPFVIVAGLLESGHCADPLQTLTLEPTKPTEIAIGAKTATTLQFPRPIQGLFGYGLTSGNDPGTYHYEHPPGSKLLAVRNLIPGKTAYVSVLLGEDDLYVLHLTPSATPPVMVRLHEAHADQEQWLARPIDAQQAEERKLTGGSEGTKRLFQLLRLGKNARVFKAALPHLFRDVESRTVEVVHDDGEVATVVTRLHRFPSEDAVFLEAHIENKTEEVLQFDPGSLQVRVGSRTHPAALVDSVAQIPAGGKIPVHVIIRGGADGERAHLSIKNEFRLLMPGYAPPAQLLGDDSQSQDPFGEDEVPNVDYDGPSDALFPSSDSDIEEGGTK